jgi:hypothetical protein
MKKGRRSYEENARQRLLDLWCGEDDFGEPIGCVATSYTFQADFFEEQCLGRFLRMDTESAEDECGYILEHATKLAQAFACVLVDQSQVAGHRSLRWHLLPVRIRGAIQHAKLTLLQWEDCVRLLVGSANLTVSGYRSNFEHMALLDFRPGAGPPITILRDALGCLRALRQFSPGDEHTVGPQQALTEFLDGVAAKTRRWGAESWHRGEPRCSLVWTGPARPSLFARMGELWSGRRARFARVLSPFFNDGKDARATTDALEQELLLARGENVIEFVVPGHRAPDVPTDEEEERRALHAKSLWVDRDARALFVVGSSNFTVSGTGLARVPNFEANLVYEIPDVNAAFAKVCGAASPPREYVDLEGDVRFLHDPDDEGETDDGSDLTPLPDAFGAALFDPVRDGGTLLLELLALPPHGFRVSGGEAMLLDGAALVTRDWPRVISVRWSRPRPPSSLDVAWEQDGEALCAVWVVNVTDRLALPPPYELHQLNLEELLQVLTSARPYHQAVARIIRARTPARPPGDGPVVDPHKKVKTSAYLLRRMKRLAAALEGLRERMQRAVFSRDALLWRLRGPLGPLALARRLAAEEGEAAGFMIAEVATTLADAKPTFGEGLNRDDARGAVRAVLQELVDLARGRPAPPNLTSYVDDVCKEVAP